MKQIVSNIRAPNDEQGNLMPDGGGSAGSVHLGFIFIMMM